MQKLQVHYYFSDDSHSMNAFVRNKAEKELLELIKNLGNVIESEVFIETEAYYEGGLKELFIIGFFSTVGFLSPAINDLIVHYLILDEQQNELEKSIKQEQLDGLILDNKKKRLELEHQLTQALTDKKSKRHVSNFYSQLNNYKKVTSVGFKKQNSNSEFIVQRDMFEQFILHDEKDVIEEDGALIEVVSPVLKEGRLKWRGLLNGERIDFSMGDSGFKKEVIESQHTFSNGTTIECFLVITITYDEFGDEKKRNYSVRKVYGVTTPNNNYAVLRNSGKRKYKEKLKSTQKDFFDKN